MYYDQDPHAASYSTHPEAGYVPHERLPVTREERAYYQSQQSQPYSLAIPRDSRALPYEREDAWHSPQAQAYGRRASPPPAPSPHIRKPYDYRSSGPSWEEANKWDNSPGTRDYETSEAWRRRDPSSSRLLGVLSLHSPMYANFVAGARC